MCDKRQGRYGPALLFQREQVSSNEDADSGLLKSQEFHIYLQSDGFFPGER
jgi:hypothetical protein